MRLKHAITVAVAALAVGAVASPASAAPAEWKPSPADFANCPAIPQGAGAWAWNCISIVVTGGQLKMGSITQNITEPMTIPVAVGWHENKVTMISQSGGFSGSWIDIPKESAPLGIEGFQVQVRQAGPITPGKMLLPETLSLKLGLRSASLPALLAPGCSLGTDAAPITVNAGLSGLKLGLKNWTPVITAKLADDAFVVPKATDCGLLTGTINSLMKLPSPSGANTMALDASIRINNYAFGDQTTLFATQNTIK
ncbi:hypothetical protein [Actinocorallia sp. A-T 12471]|uniref:hypothetical protein n=1 Tax=Actinocorallia sp. A-T 12471 TaxID=3089813 RepID=UPI0029CFD1DD|nr:hypothetical protein [Actinocorallia sp. A-T 12471]MDX6744470.1 hypothetical protein [Actinocorallia sp. A-T 12471]